MRCDLNSKRSNSKSHKSRFQLCINTGDRVSIVIQASMLKGPRLRPYSKRDGKGSRQYGRKYAGLAKVSRNRCTTDTSLETLSPFSSLLQEVDHRSSSLSPFNLVKNKPGLHLSPLATQNTSLPTTCDINLPRSTGSSSAHSNIPSKPSSTCTEWVEATSGELPVASTPNSESVICLTTSPNSDSVVCLTSSPIVILPDEAQEDPLGNTHTEMGKQRLNFSDDSCMLLSVDDKGGQSPSTLSGIEYCHTPSPLVLKSFTTPSSMHAFSKSSRSLLTSHSQRRLDNSGHHRSPLSTRVKASNVNSLCESLADCKLSGQHTPSPSTPISVVSSPLLRYLSPAHSLLISDREKVLSLCQQEEPVPLEDIFTSRMISTITKLGDGTFAEVFGAQDEQENGIALKIIPIEGDFPYNGEPQSTFSEILPEMVISRELSNLGDQINKENGFSPHFTTNFLQIYRMCLCCGKFPQFLLDVWDKHDKEHSSENDRPDIFPQDQLYIVFVTKEAGKPLDDYTFNSFEEATSILTQLAATIAVGEAALEFEHRDLHQGNILVQSTAEKMMYFRLDGEDLALETHGVLVTVVDYTLSRICQGSCVSYNDLNKLEWLFTAKGDLQFDVYREMRDTANKDWRLFHPYTNVLWLHYVLVKTSQRSKLSKRIQARSWRAHFRGLIKDILESSTAKDALSNLFLPMCTT